MHGNPVLRERHRSGERGLWNSGRAEAGKEGPRSRGSDGVSAHKHAVGSARLSSEIGRIIKLPDISERLAVQGALPVGNSAEEFDAFVKSEMNLWGKLAQKIGLRAD